MIKSRDLSIAEKRKKHNQSSICSIFSSYPRTIHPSTHGQAPFNAIIEAESGWERGGERERDNGGLWYAQNRKKEEVNPVIIANFLTRFYMHCSKSLCRSLPGNVILFHQSPRAMMTSAACAYPHAGVREKEAALCGLNLGWLIIYNALVLKVFIHVLDCVSISIYLCLYVRTRIAHAWYPVESGRQCRVHLRDI